MFSNRCFKWILAWVFFAQWTAFTVESQAQSVEILVVGVAQDAGHPQIDCAKSCCEEITKPHLVSSLVIASDASFYFIDATPDFPAQLKAARRQYPDKTFGGIFLTHAHIGHYTGLMYLGKEAANADRVVVYAMPKMGSFLLNNGPWNQLLTERNIDMLPMKHDDTIQLERLSITPIVVPHRDEYSETVAFMIASEIGKLLYVPDIDKWDQWYMDIEELVREVDYAFVDGTFYAEGELPGRSMADIPHPFVSETMQRLSTLDEMDRAKVHFIHLNHTNPLLDSTSEATREVKQAGFQIAKEGMKLAF